MPDACFLFTVNAKPDAVFNAIASADGISTWSGVDFLHSGWSGAGEHYRTSCYCWAMYLRLMKKYAETGDEIPYGERLDA